ncbi:MAG: hypothetical protein ABL984_03135 [Pyrinomonadaceae bacterium]
MRFGRTSAPLQGNDQLRVDKRVGTSEWVLLDLLTTTTATVSIASHTPGQPESGHIRALFRKKNANVRSYSPEYRLRFRELGHYKNLPRSLTPSKPSTASTTGN